MTRFKSLSPNVFWQAIWVASAAITIWANFIRQPEITARIYTNIDEHTPLNHGQISIEVDLGAHTFYSFGGCGPHWQSTDPDHTPPTYKKINCEVERLAADLKGYELAPYRGGWVEIVK